MRRIMMKKGRLWMGLGLLVLGAILIAVPLSYDWYTSKQNAELVQAMDLLKTDGLNNETAPDINFSKEELKSIYELEIPSIHLKEFVLPSTTEENLAISLTQIIEDQDPNTDNISIAGHRGYRGDRHFRNLPDVKKGDEIILTTDNDRYSYKVTEIKTVEEDAVEVLENNGAEITLLTCTLSGDKRVVVKGKLS
ncbi:class D sortase [Virgibacillus salarius]|uniref:class D sortase n=2 Tax=Virgibacillus salarius TaxID=447199 RepID=UPI0009B72C45|nr:class D sortase [Priestia megaterium]